MKILIAALVIFFSTPFLVTSQDDTATITAAVSTLSTSVSSVTSALTSVSTSASSTTSVTSASSTTTAASTGLSGLTTGGGSVTSSSSSLTGGSGTSTITTDGSSSTSASVTSVASSVTAAVASTTSGSSTTSAATSSTSTASTSAASTSTSAASIATSGSTIASTTLAASVTGAITSAATSATTTASTSASTTTSTAATIGDTTSSSTSTASSTTGAALSTLTSTLTSATSSLTSATSSTSDTTSSITSSSTTALTSTTGTTSSATTALTSTSGTTGSVATTSTITDTTSTSSSTSSSSVTGASTTTSSATTGAITTSTSTTGGGGDNTPAYGGYPGLQWIFANRSFAATNHTGADVKITAVTWGDNQEFFIAATVTPQSSFNFVYIAKYGADKTSVVWEKKYECSGEIYIKKLMYTSSSESLSFIGSFKNTIVLDNELLVGSTTARDVVVGTLDGNGVEMWVSIIFSEGEDEPAGITFDHLNQLVVAGSATGQNVSFGTSSLCTRQPIEKLGLLGTKNVFIGKYDRSGCPVWGNGYSGFPAEVNGLAGNEAGTEFIVVGSFENSLIFGGLPTIEAEKRETFVTKFSTSTGIPIWSFASLTEFGEVDYGISEGMSVAFDGNGDFYVTGTVVADVLTFGFAEPNLNLTHLAYLNPSYSTNLANGGVYLAKFPSDIVPPGSAYWIAGAVVEPYSSSETAEITSTGIVLDLASEAGNNSNYDIYICGSYARGISAFSADLSFDDTYQELKTGALTPTIVDVYIFGYNSEGDLDYAVGAGTPLNSETVLDITVEKQIGPVIVGEFDGTYTQFESFVVQSAGGSTTGFIAQYGAVSVTNTTDNSTTGNFNSTSTTTSSSTSTSASTTTSSSTSSSSSTTTSGGTSSSSSTATTSSSITSGSMSSGSTSTSSTTSSSGVSSGSSGTISSTTSGAVTSGLTSGFTSSGITSSSTTGSITSTITSGMSSTTGGTTTSGTCSDNDRGCDGICFSGVVMDACGVCGGNDTCEISCKYGSCLPCMLNDSCGCGSQVLCPSGHCASDVFKCNPVTVLCPENDDVITEEDPSKSFVCADGTCETLPLSCRSKGNFMSCRLHGGTVCWDGSCRATQRECPPVPRCPLSSPKRCPDGSCILADDSCDPSRTSEKRQLASVVLDNGGIGAQPCSDEGFVRCADGFCREDKLFCPEYFGCSFDSPIQCPDGSCVNETVGFAGCPKCETGNICFSGACREQCEEIPEMFGPIKYYVDASGSDIEIEVREARGFGVTCGITIESGLLPNSVIQVKSIPDSVLRNVIPLYLESNDGTKCDNEDDGKGKQKIVSKFALSIHGSEALSQIMEIECEVSRDDNLCLARFVDMKWECIADTPVDELGWARGLVEKWGDYAFIAKDVVKCEDIAQRESKDDSASNEITGFGIAVIIVSFFVCLALIGLVALFIVLAVKGL